jgi:hypothetical protein
MRRKIFYNFLLFIDYNKIDCQMIFGRILRIVIFVKHTETWS